METVMKTNFIGTALIALLSLNFVTPAFAADQSDVKECRRILTQETNIQMDRYRLRFEKEDGVRNRVLTFTAIPHSSKFGESRFEVKCQFDREQVVALYQNQTTLFAKNSQVKTKPAG